MNIGSEPPPGIYIPCENLEALKELILELYKVGILTNESWEAVNTPPNFLEIMNDSSYFETGEICGIRYRKSGVKELVQKTEDLI